jgi:hypothetical protein
MAHDLTEVSTFTATVQVPDDGDFVQEAAFEPGYQSLANRTLFLKDKFPTSTDNAVARYDLTAGKLQNSGVLIEDDNDVTGIKDLTISGSILYATPKAGAVPYTAARRLNGNGTVGGYGEVTISTNSQILYYDLTQEVPEGATITSVVALVDPGAIRAGGNRMRLQIERCSRNYVTPGTGSQTAVSDTYDNGTTATIQNISSGVIAVVVAKASGEMLQARVYGGNDASSNNDIVYGLLVSFTEPGVK